VRAVIVREFGPVETLSLGEVPAPVPGPHEVLVKVRATAVNYVDLLVISGKYQFLPERPFTPGKGPAGEVVATGSEVKSLSVGDRVLAMAEHGGYGEMVAVAENQCYCLPESMSYVEAASMSLAYDTAWFALRDRARLVAGDVVFVMGASGGVGYAAVQLAKAMGARVLAGISTPSKAAFVRDAGADEIILLNDESLRESLRTKIYAANGGRGVDIILDPLGGDFFDAAIRALDWRGRMVVIGFAAGRIPVVKANYLLVKNIEVSGLQVSDYRKRTPELVAKCFEEIFGWYCEGRLKPAAVTMLPLSDVVRALVQIRDRTAHGRLILTQDKKNNL
jgi:NADPH2:quinone reductase